MVVVCFSMSWVLTGIAQQPGETVTIMWAFFFLCKVSENPKSILNQDHNHFWTLTKCCHQGTCHWELATLQKNTKGGLNFLPLFSGKSASISIQMDPPSSIGSHMVRFRINSSDIQILDLSFLSQSIKRLPCFETLTIAPLTAWWKFHKITNTTFFFFLNNPSKQNLTT